MPNPRAVAAGLPLVKLRLQYEKKAVALERDELEHRYDWYNRRGCDDPECHYHARPKQRPPDGKWFVWLLRTGRRWGKTKTGAEWVREQVENGGRRRGALVSDTAADVRDIMIEGEAGILATSPPWFRPHYEPSKRRLTWPNGAVATTYSAEDPEQLRGGGHDFAWADELAKWHHQREAWDNLVITLSSGLDPRCIVTTTPRPTPLVKELSKHDGEDVVMTLGHTMENIDNLAPTVRQEVIDRYEGTRLGRQELAGEILEDVEGALWRLAQIDAHRIDKAPDLDRVVVAIDPSGSSEESASEQGIVVAGAALCACNGNGTSEKHGFALADLSGHYTPEGWARRAIAGLDAHKADRIIGEANFGGQMVEATLRAIDRSVPYKAVHASRGKQVRAEPIAALGEQGKIHHVGTLSLLEDQLTNWVPGERSPDRLDAYVWAFTELMMTRRSIVAY